MTMTCFSGDYFCPSSVKAQGLENWAAALTKLEPPEYAKFLAILSAEIVAKRKPKVTAVNIEKIEPAYTGDGKTEAHGVHFTVAQGKGKGGIEVVKNADLWAMLYDAMKKSAFTVKSDGPMQWLSGPPAHADIQAIKTGKNVPLGALAAQQLNLYGNIFIDADSGQIVDGATVAQMKVLPESIKKCVSLGGFVATVMEIQEANEKKIDQAMDSLAEQFALVGKNKKVVQVKSLKPLPGKLLGKPPIVPKVNPMLVAQALGAELPYICNVCLGQGQHNTLECMGSFVQPCAECGDVLCKGHEVKAEPPPKIGVDLSNGIDQSVFLLDIPFTLGGSIKAWIHMEIFVDRVMAIASMILSKKLPVKAAEITKSPYNLGLEDGVAAAMEKAKLGYHATVINAGARTVIKTGPLSYLVLDHPEPPMGEKCEWLCHECHGAKVVPTGHYPGEYDFVKCPSCLETGLAIEEYLGAGKAAGTHAVKKCVACDGESCSTCKGKGWFPVYTCETCKDTFTLMKFAKGQLVGTKSCPDCAVKKAEPTVGKMIMFPCEGDPIEAGDQVIITGAGTIRKKKSPLQDAIGVAVQNEGPDHTVMIAIFENVEVPKSPLAPMPDSSADLGGKFAFQNPEPTHTLVTISPDGTVRFLAKNNRPIFEFGPEGEFKWLLTGKALTMDVVQDFWQAVEKFNPAQKTIKGLQTALGSARGEIEKLHAEIKVLKKAELEAQAKAEWERLERMRETPRATRFRHIAGKMGEGECSET